MKENIRKYLTFRQNTIRRARVMTEKKNKRSLMTNISMIIRGYKIIFKLFPRYLFWNTLSNVWNHLTPYFGLFMSSLILNELVGDCDGRVLARLAAITVTGAFIIGLLGRLIPRDSGDATFSIFSIGSAICSTTISRTPRLSY